MGRPTGVTVIAVLCFIGGAFALLGGVGMMAGGGIVASMMSQQGAAAGPMAGIIASVGAAVGVFLLIIAVVDIVVGVGLLKLKEWARMVTIILTGIGAALGVLGLLGGFVHFVLVATIFRLCILAVEVWIIMYLLKPDVKAAFQGAQARPAAA
jgi:uncharacterized membrane protein (DUF2068 family)